MRLTITGADRPLGAALCRGLAAMHAITPVGESDDAPHDLGGVADAYRRADLNQPPSAAAVLRGADMVVHAQPHDPAIGPGDAGEAELLERIARGTYVLTQAAVEARIGRLVLISDIRLFDAVPEEYVVNAGWQPRPRPEAASLAPYLAELTVREIARVGHIEAVSLRLGALDAADGTSAAAAVDAVNRALTEDVRATGYHWLQKHIVSGGRFASTWED
jgi:nucleoside-diphosphate-sugar epimerase